eukprot:6182475-Pleurochrysis_carterae.AAC.1
MQRSALCTLECQVNYNAALGATFRTRRSMLLGGRSAALDWCCLLFYFYFNTALGALNLASKKCCEDQKLVLVAFSQTLGSAALRPFLRNAWGGAFGSSSALGSTLCTDWLQLVLGRAWNI